MAGGENAVFEIAKLFGIAGKVHASVNQLQLARTLSTSGEDSVDPYLGGLCLACWMMIYGLTYVFFYKCTKCKVQQPCALDHTANF